MFFRYHLFLQMFCLLYVVNATGQIIDTVIFQGLSRTDEDYLRRFLQHVEGSHFEEKGVQRDEQVLRNLYPVAEVQFYVDSSDAFTLVYEIDEAMTLFPIVGIGAVRDNAWFQLGIKDIHSGGKGIEWSAVYGNIDRRSNLYLSFKNLHPGGSRLGFSINPVKWASTEPLYFDEGQVTYDYDISYLGISGIYEIKVNQYLEIATAYFREKYVKARDQILVHPPGPESLKEYKSLYKILHSIDRKNYESFYVSGFDIRSTWQTVHTWNNTHWFHIILNDLVWFTRWRRSGNLGFRLRMGLSTNDVTPFAPFVIDSRVNIRGSGNRIDRGTGQLILNTEYRHTLFDAGYFAGQMVAFSDMGTWRNPGGQLSDFTDPENFRHFMGLGVRVLYKRAFNAVLRLDYGVDIYDHRQRGFVFGFGQYF